jgi:hypothetical protein
MPTPDRFRLRAGALAALAFSALVAAPVFAKGTLV